MSHSIVLKIGAIVLTVFGLAMLLAPNALMAVYRTPELNNSGIYNSMLYGALMLGTAWINWKTSTVDLDQAQPVISGMLLFLVLGLAVALYRQLIGAASPVAWVNVGIFAVFTLLFVRLAFSAAASHASVGHRRVV